MGHTYRRRHRVEMNARIQRQQREQRQQQLRRDYPPKPPYITGAVPLNESPGEEATHEEPPMIISSPDAVAEKLQTWLQNPPAEATQPWRDPPPDDDPPTTPDFVRVRDVLLTPTETPAAETVPPMAIKNVERGSLSQFVARHANLDAPILADEARRLLALAKDEGLKTTFGSLAQCIMVARKKRGAAPAKAAKKNGRAKTSDASGLVTAPARHARKKKNGAADDLDVLVPQMIAALDVFGRGLKVLIDDRTALKAKVTRFADAFAKLAD